MEWLIGILSGTLSGGIVIFSFQKIISNRLKYAIKHEYDKKFEEIKTSIQEASIIEQKRWELKREACLKALHLANCVLSHYTSSGADDIHIMSQKTTIDKARECYDELACTCESSEILNILHKILFKKSGAFDIISDLRNAIRKELFPYSQKINCNREEAFIASLACCN